MTARSFSVRARLLAPLFSESHALCLIQHNVVRRSSTAPLVCLADSVYHALDPGH